MTQKQLTEERLIDLLKNLPFNPTTVLLGSKQLKEFSNQFFPRNRVGQDLKDERDFKITAFTWEHGIINIVEFNDYGIEPLNDFIGFK